MKSIKNEINGEIVLVNGQKTQYCQDVSSFQLDLQIQCNLNQNLRKLFCEYQKTDYKVIINFIYRGKRPILSNTILKEKNNGEQTLLDFKTYYKSTVTKTVCYWQRIDRSMESSEIDPHKYSQLIFDKVAKAILWSKDSLFNKWCWNNWTSTCKKK